MAALTNKTALITGASRGIGRAIAECLAAEGARIIVHYNQQAETAEAVVAGLPGEGHVAIKADLGDPNSVEQLMTNAIEQCGNIDIVVNNAGIWEEHILKDCDYATWQKAWQRTLDVNLTGPANLCFLAAKQMIAQGGGRIINISSRGAFRGEPAGPAYAAGKAGLNAMSQSLAQALAPHNIFVYVVAPGFVETDMAAEMLTGPNGDAIRSQSPMGRVGRPDEVARAVLFFASEGTDYLTGAIIDANGASYLRS